MDFVYKILNQVDETIRWTTSLVSSSQSFETIDDKVKSTSDEIIRYELLNKYGLAIQTPQYGTISSLSHSYESTFVSNNVLSRNLSANGFIRRYFIQTFQDKTYSDQLINDLSSIIYKYYTSNRLELMSKMNKHEGFGILTSSNNCMFLITSMMIDKKQIIESKNNKANIEFEIVSKHSTSLFSVSFGIIGIQRKYYHQLLQHISTYFTNNNTIGYKSGWYLMVRDINTVLKNDDYESSDRCAVELFGFNTPHFVMIQSAMKEANLVPGCYFTDGPVCQGDKILIKISHGNCVSIYHNKKRILYLNRLNGDDYLYFPFVGDTYNNNFEFELCQR